MKKSKFCVALDKGNELVLANIRTGHLVKFKDEYIDAVLDLLEHGSESGQNISQFLPVYLYEHSYLVEKDVNEEEIQRRDIERIKNNDGMLNFIIMPTDDCNFRCPYCYEDHIKRNMTIEYMDKIALFVDKNIDRFRGLKVEWFGGEPLLQLESIYYLTERLIKICNAHKKPFLSGMTTNAYLLTRDVFEKLRKLRFLGYQITLDGLAETHDKQRYLVDGRGSWDVIISNLRAIKNTPCRGFMNITIRTNFSKAMLKSAKEYIDFLYREFGDDRRFHYFLRVIADFGGERIHKMEDSLITDKKTMIDVQKYASSLGLRMNIQRDGLSAGGMVCYANRRNNYTLGSDEIIRKTTCEYDNPLNHLGYFNDQGDMVIDIEKENLWVDGYSCENEQCPYRITCVGDGCPANHLIRKNKPCIWNAASVEEILDILSVNPSYIPIYSEVSK